MKGFIILEEFEQLIYESTEEVFEQLQPYIDESPELELIPGSGLYRVKHHGENTAFYVLQVTLAEAQEVSIFRECELPEFLEE